MLLPVPALGITLFLALSRLIEIFLLVVEEIFKLLVEQHLISITDGRVLIALLAYRLSHSCWSPRLRVIGYCGWRALLGGLRRISL